jgi:hypothetical protein
MSLITCLGSCVYQKEGYCSLDSISAWKGTVQGKSCIYFAEKTKDDKPSAAEVNTGNPR